MPAKVAQSLFVALVSDNVARELVRPESDAGFGRVGVPAPVVSMPEASVNEYGQPMFREDQVGAAGKVLSIQAEAESQTVSDTADGTLGHRVPSSDPRHVFASPPAIHNVCHDPRTPFDLLEHVTIMYSYGERRTDQEVIGCN